jgi:hypothetical protein
VVGRRFAHAFAAPDLLDADQLALHELRGFYSDGDSGAVRPSGCGDGQGERTAAMITRIYSVRGDRLYIDTSDLARARQRGRKLIPSDDSGGARVSRPGARELLLQVDNIADAAGTKTAGRSVQTEP